MTPPVNLGSCDFALDRSETKSNTPRSSRPAYVPSLASCVMTLDDSSAVDGSDWVADEGRERRTGGAMTSVPSANTERRSSRRGAGKNWRVAFFRRFRILDSPSPQSGGLLGWTHDRRLPQVEDHARVARRESARTGFRRLPNRVWRSVEFLRVRRPKASIPLRALCPSAFAEGVGAMSGGWAADRRPAIPVARQSRGALGQRPLPEVGNSTRTGDRCAPGVVVIRADASWLRLFVSVRLSVVPPKPSARAGAGR